VVIGYVIDMFPQHAAVALIERHSPVQFPRVSLIIGEHGVEEYAGAGSVRLRFERNSHVANPGFTRVERAAEEPSRAWIAIRHDHFGERASIEHLPRLPLIFVTDGIEHQPFARMQSVAKTPILPAHFAASRFE